LKQDVISNKNIHNDLISYERLHWQTTSTRYSIESYPRARTLSERLTQQDNNSWRQWFD